MPKRINRLRFLVCPSMLLLLTAGSLAARDYWVALDGKDGTAGTQDDPLRSVAAAGSLMQAGDTLWIRAGRYEEELWLEGLEATAEQWTNVSAAPGDERQVILGITKPKVDNSPRGVGLSDCKYIRVRGIVGFSAYHGRGAGLGASRCEYVQFIECVAAHGGAGGIDANHCDHVLIDGCETYFNGGGTGYSSGISVYRHKSPDVIVRNCVSYGNYDDSCHETDGNGIIIDAGFREGGALVYNNLAYMNGGKGICATFSDNVTMLNNTSVANCWHPAQQRVPHEFGMRGDHVSTRNNIGVNLHDHGFALWILPKGLDHGKRIDLDPTTMRADHNLWWAPNTDAVIGMAGGPDTGWKPFTWNATDDADDSGARWTGDSLNADPRFVDMLNHDYRLRPDSPALSAGVSLRQVHADLTGKLRPETGPITLGCYQGAYDRTRLALPEPGVTFGDGEATEAMRALLANTYAIEWRGMLWGWGQLLYEQLPLIVDIEGPRRADFLELQGFYQLGELLDRLAEKHQVRMVLRQPAACRGAGTDPQVISDRVAIRPGADAEERGYVRRQLRVRLWTDDRKGLNSMSDQLRALGAAIGVAIDSEREISGDQHIIMITRNMPVGCALADLAERLDTRFVLSRRDPLAGDAPTPVELDETFGDTDVIVGLTVEKDGLGYIDIDARIDDCYEMRARLLSETCRFLGRLATDDVSYFPFFHKMPIKKRDGMTLRYAVIGNAMAMNVNDQWVMLNRTLDEAIEGTFAVKLHSDQIKVSNLRYALLGKTIAGH